MRIVYGVSGAGRGHATRALAVLPELCSGNQVLLLAGGAAIEALAPVHPVIPIPTLRHAYSGARLSTPETIRQNLSLVSDLLSRGAELQRVSDLLAAFKPHVALSDSDPFTHRAATWLGVPRISFDHLGILAHCRPELPHRLRPTALRDLLAYRLLMGQPDRAIVSSFYSAPARSGVRLVGPVLRAEVIDSRPERGEHLVVYLGQGLHRYTPRMARVLRALGVPVLIHGAGEEGADGTIVHRQAGDPRFVADMASCRAVICTAGNQIIGEAIHLGKPLLVLPEESTEQRANAWAVQRLNVGEVVASEDVQESVVWGFLSRAERYVDRQRWLAHDGRREAVSAIERFASELGARKVRIERLRRVA